MSFLGAMLSGFGDIFTSPFKNTGALWLLVPLFLLWLVLTVYFGIYSDEPLGWNSALGNAISMFWVFVSLLAFLFNKPSIDWIKTAALLIFFSYALFIVIISFKHAISKKIAFIIASPTILFFFSWFAVVWTYGALKLSLAVFVDVILLTSAVLGTVELLKFVRAKYMGKSIASDAKEDIDENLDDIE